MKREIVFKKWRREMTFLSKCITALCSFAILSISMPAFADQCETINENEEWGMTFVQIKEQFEKKDYSAALENAEKLKKICAKSPVLNYTIARIYRALGDNTNGTYYIQNAAKFSAEFSVNETLLEQLWSERYEIEHPDARPESIEASKNEIVELRANNQALQNQLAEAERQRMETEQKQIEFLAHENQRETRNYYAGLWTGVGIGIAGAVLFGVGTAMAVINTDNQVEFDEGDYLKARPTVKHDLFVGMSASGAALTIAGTIMAGVMGYRYSQSKKRNDTTLSLQVAPTNVGLSLNF